MGKCPAFQFYPSDWLNDTQLQMAQASSRGIWINFLCHMWWAPVKGSLSGTIDQLRQLAKCTLDEMRAFFEDIQVLGFADVTPNVTRVTPVDTKVTLTNRRMFRDEQSRMAHTSRQKKYRDRQRDAKVTPPSSNTSTTSNTPNPPRVPPCGGTESLNGFYELWKLHPGPKGPKPDALAAYRLVKPPAEAVEAMRVQIAYAAECARRGVFWPQLQHLHRWIKKRRWEDELPSLVPEPGQQPPAASIPQGPIDPKGYWKSRDEYLTARKAGRVPPSQQVPEWNK